MQVRDNREKIIQLAKRELARREFFLLLQSKGWRLLQEKP